MISITILTKNSAQTLAETLDSTARFPEVIVLDSGSTDTTLQIAARYSNVRIFHTDFFGFGPTHNLATSHAAHDWILSIDSDEVLTPELQDELLALQPTPGTAYALLRHNYFNGKHIKGCAGWHPDWIVRLYNRKETRFNDAQVHEKILTGHLTTLRLKSPLKHTPYRTISHFLEKMDSYSRLFAEQNAYKKPPTLLRACASSTYAFIKSYLLKRGFRAGSEGLIISLYNAHATYYKYLMLREMTLSKSPYPTKKASQ